MSLCLQMSPEMGLWEFHIQTISNIVEHTNTYTFALAKQLAMLYV